MKDKEPEADLLVNFLTIPEKEIDPLNAFRGLLDTVPELNDKTPLSDRTKTLIDPTVPENESVPANILDVLFTLLPDIFSDPLTILFALLLTVPEANDIEPSTDFRKVRSELNAPEKVNVPAMILLVRFTILPMNVNAPENNFEVRFDTAPEKDSDPSQDWLYVGPPASSLLSNMIMPISALRVYEIALVASCRCSGERIRHR